MYKAVILPLAKQDIGEAARWYNERQPGLGKRFTAHIRQKIRFICQHPAAIAVLYDDIRTIVLDSFPYMIHFAVDDQAKLVIVLAVLSTHRDPALWKGR